MAANPWQGPSGPGYRGDNRSARSGGPSGVRSTYASQLREHEALFNTYEHLQGLTRGDSALALLRKVASMVKPMMRKRGWTVRTLAEFLPSESNLLGLNINRGQKICIRLRYHNNPDLFLPIEQIVDTMLHELSHNVWGEHDGNFHRLWDELRDEYETLLIKGFTGEGFLGRGQRLGGRSNVPPPQEMRRLARASAEQRQTHSGLGTGSGRRLGGTPLHSGQNVREVIAGQALLRTTVNRGCGSIRKDADVLADGRQTFKTQAEEDDANNRAIAEALFDLMEAEETAKLNGTFQEPHAGGGLTWTKEHGLSDPSVEQQPLRGTSISSDIPSEEEQMRWALEESQHLAPQNGDNFGGLPPESLVSPMTPNSAARSRAPSLAASIRHASVVAVSPVSDVQSPPLSRSSRAPSVAAGHPLHPIVDLSEPFNPDEWACEICTCVNPMQFLACDACGTERSKKANKRKRLRRAADTRQNHDTTTGPQGLGWNCQRCGTFMEHKWWTCSACGLMKASS